MRIIYLFIDGIGFGDNDPNKNPFTRFAKSYFRPLGGLETALPEGFHIIPTDAAMGMPGLPQSATGQTSLWTGKNGPEALGRHMTGFPGPTLIRVIKEHSVIKRFVENGKRATLLNTYSEAYLQRIDTKPRLASASTHVQRASGQPLLTMDHLRDGKGIYMDITHEVMHMMFPESANVFPIQDPYQRGKDVVKIAQDYDLVLFEYFITDKAGHDMSFEMAGRTIEILEPFIQGIIDAMDPKEELFLLTSDHGNMEDLSVKTHTRNQVPTFAYGKSADSFLENVKSLMDIVPTIYDVFPLGDAKHSLNGSK